MSPDRGEQYLTAGPDRGQGAHGPLQGFGGSAPKVLPLTLEGGARNPKETQRLVPIS